MSTSDVRAPALPTLPYWHLSSVADVCGFTIHGPYAAHPRQGITHNDRFITIFLNILSHLSTMLLGSSLFVVFLRTLYLAHKYQQICQEQPTLRTRDSTARKLSFLYAHVFRSLLECVSYSSTLLYLDLFRTLVGHLVEICFQPNRYSAGPSSNTSSSPRYHFSDSRVNLPRTLQVRFVPANLSEFYAQLGSVSKEDRIL